ncbi:hypothetical protein HanRHA438_Chr09g0412041 [Helianthus annuus]|nr:hypothetical protein HanHA300_Chr09g0328481 [Helianthus annuus]KAJ0535483.1 hypothetical protein HanIR_Chr09g0431131 [Helianthus annuus]KAJ0543315.1 hypothetical protein HanHA89_Chr09g0349381 [Helianthus annuus]KAJ0708373.1 hypothetical protein HanLR1_Chr09g0328731 [Helianthus annuus]KAJ0889360.1 hypothetical protein HanRHA438_Chr09g0412041 [Helianthus annuus]
MMLGASTIILEKMKRQPVLDGVCYRLTAGDRPETITNRRYQLRVCSSVGWALGMMMACDQLWCYDDLKMVEGGGFWWLLASRERQRGREI